MKKESRVKWIDALRGIGMCLVIIGHMTIPEVVRRCIFSFHMPLFFFLSGYLFKNRCSMKWIARKVDCLLVPYVIYSFITLGVLLFANRCEFRSGLRQIIKGNGIGITWFFMCLFVVELCGSGLVRLKAFGRNRAYWTLLILAVLGWCVPKFGWPSICKSNAVLTALTFWGLGYVLKRVEFTWWQLLVGLVFAMLFWHQRVDMNSGLLGNGFMFYGTAVGFIVILVWAFRKWEISFKPLVFVGERSLEFMCMHALIPIFLTTVVSRCQLQMPSAFMRIVSLVAVIFASWGIHRYSSLLSGKISVLQKFA